MHARKLSIDGAYEFTPPVFPDNRGFLAAPFQEPAFIEATGHSLFPVRQCNHSQSRRGVVRGVHFTATPPGMVKYVYCPRGKALDIVVDVRVGSTTFGQWDSVVLDADELHGVYLPVGLGHGFVALEDDTVMLYLLSEGYVPKNELAVSFTDTTLGLPIPDDLEPIISERDRMAPTLAEARDKGLLPEYATCLELQAGL